VNRSQNPSFFTAIMVGAVVPGLPLYLIFGTDAGAYGTIVGAIAFLVLSASRTAKPASASATATSDAPLSQLDELAALRDKGAITPVEFEAKKGELLKRV